MQCEFGMFYVSSPRDPPLIGPADYHARPGMHQTCENPDLHPVERRRGSDMWTCRSCGAKGVIDDGGGN